MAYTVTPAVPTGAYVKTTLTQTDFMGEGIVKGNLLYNSGGLYQDAMRAYEGLSQPAISKGSVSSQHVLSGQNLTATDLGAWPKAGDVLILAFQREHPVASMAGVQIYNEFVIIGPHPDIVNDVGPAPVVTFGETFATATTRPETLGALIAWLEDSLVVTVLRQRYEGGWSYDAANTRFATLNKQYDSFNVS